MHQTPFRAKARTAFAEENRKTRRLTWRTFVWPAFLPLIILSGILVNFFPTQHVFAAPAASSSTPGHNTFQQFLAEGQKSKASHSTFVYPKPKTPLKSGGIVPPKPSAEPLTMQPLSATLSASALSPQVAGLSVKPLDLKSSDSRLEVQVPNGAIDLTHATNAKGARFNVTSGTSVTLRISEVHGYLPGELPELGAYQVQVLDAQGNALHHVVLRTPLTFVYHYQPAALAALHLNPNQMFLAWPQLIATARTNKHSTSNLLIPLKNNATTYTLTAQSQVVDTVSPMVVVGSADQQRPPVPLQASVQGNSGNFGLTYPFKLAPSNFAPTLQLTYSTAAPNSRHDPRATADDAGDGWQLSMGAITSVVENGTTWYFINGVDNVSDRLIPIPGQAGFFETEHISHLKIQQSGTSFNVWDPSGNYYQFGATADSKQYTTSGTTQTTYRWDLSTEILANEGPGTVQRQIRVSYLQDISGSNVRDSAIKQIIYQLTPAQGSPIIQGTVDFSYLAPFNLNGTTNVVFATQYNYGVNYSCTQGTPPVTPTWRCDDPMTYGSGSGSVPPPTTMSTMSLQSITSYIGDDGSSTRIAHQYNLAYTDTPISTCIDAYSQIQYYCAGEHLLSSITPSDSLQGTIHHLQPVNFQYTSEQNQYYDSGNKTSNGAQQYQVTTNWSYLTKYNDTNTGNGELISYGTAQNNTHGTPSVTDSQGFVIDNQLDPLYCQNQQSNPDVTKRCTGTYANPDDKAWSQQVVTQRQGLGTDTSNSTVKVATTMYHYQLSTTGSNTVGDNWIPSGDTNWLNYFYDGAFKGFAAVNILSPSGDLTVNHYYGTEGWGTPPTDLINYASGSLTEQDVYSGSSTTGPLLEQTINAYGGASGSNTVTSCDTAVTGMFIPCETVLLSTQKTLVDGDTTPTADTSMIDLYTYDDYNPSASGTGLLKGSGHYHNLTQDQRQELTGTRSNMCPVGGPCGPVYGYGMTTLLTQKWQYAMTDQVSGWTYYDVNKVKESELDDPSGNIWQCQTTQYDEGVTSGAPTPDQGLGTTIKTYSSANCAGQTSPLTTIYTGYDSNGNPVAAVDAFAAANGGLYSSNGCTLAAKPAIVSSAWSNTRYTSCTTYDGYGAQPTQTTNALGQITTIAYDNTQQSFPVSGTDANGQQTSLAYSYDNSGNMTTQVSLPLETGSYSHQGTSYSNCTGTSTLPCYEEDSNTSLYASAISRTFYGSRGRAVETRTPGPTPGDDTIVMTVYNDQAHTVWKSVPFQVAHGAGWIDPNTAKDINGVTPAGSVTFYDALGRAIAVQDPNYGSSQEPGIACSTTLSGTYTSCVNYSVGYTGDTEPDYPFVRPVGVTPHSPKEKATSVDPNGHVSVTYSDAAGRLIYADMDSGVYGGTLTVAKDTYIEYNLLNKPISIRVADGQSQNGQGVTTVTTTATYDDLGRLLTVSDPDQGNFSYTYDADGRVLSITQTSGSNSRTLGYNYDLLGRLGCEQTATPTINATGACSAGNPLVQNTYDTTILGTKGSTDFPIGKLTQSVATTYYPDGTSASVTSQAQYDKRGRAITSQELLGLPSAWGNITPLAYQANVLYNDADQVTTTSTSGSGGYTFTDVYDPTNGALTGLSNNSSNTANLAQLSFNEYGQLGTLTYLNGASSSPTNLVSETFNYDGDLRPTSLSASWLPSSNNSGQILNQGRSYDNAGNVTSINSLFASVSGQSGSGGSETQNFCYDEQNRLIWSGNSGTQPGAGNGTCGSGTLVSGLSGAGYTAPFTYTNLGQIWQGPLNGQGSVQQYLYCNSQPHQLNGIYPAGTTCANMGSATASYSASYDPWGNITSRTYNSVTATLTYDALNRLTTYSSSNGQEQYVYDASGNRILKRSTSGSTTTLSAYPSSAEEYDYTGTGTLTSQLHYYAMAGHLIGAFDGTNTTYYLTDPQGSVLTSFSQSGVQGEQVYGPYGNQRYTAGTINTSKGYTGQIQDKLTGLDYYNARFYDPVVGQFLSPDSEQGNMQGMNPYAYVKGNPETNTDPSGHMQVGVGGGDGDCCGDSSNPPPPPPPSNDPPPDAGACNSYQCYNPGNGSPTANPTYHRPPPLPHSGPCTGTSWCPGAPKNSSHETYLNKSHQVTTSNTVYGVGKDGLQSLINILTQIELNLNQPDSGGALFNLLSTAASIAGIVAAFATLVGAIAAAGTVAAAIATGVSVYGGLVSAAAGAIATDVSKGDSGPSALEAVQELVATLNGFEGTLSKTPAAIAEKFVFVLNEVDTYGTMPIYRDNPGGGYPAATIVGYQTDYSNIVSAQFNLSYYLIN